MRKPKVIIVIEGGCVQDVLVSKAADVFVIDYDTDGTDAMEIPQPEGGTETAHCFSLHADLHPKQVNQLARRINEHEAEP